MRRLRAWRIQQLLSIRELAVAADITPKTLINLEHGQRRPTDRTMHAISDTLGDAPTEIAEFAAAMEARRVRSHFRPVANARSRADKREGGCMPPPSRSTPTPDGRRLR